MNRNLCRAALLLLTLLLSVATTWAASTFGGGDGSAKNPYLITSSAHWDQLSADVAAGTNYSGQYFQLDDDISVATMLGTGTNGLDHGRDSHHPLRRFRGLHQFWFFHPHEQHLLTCRSCREREKV